MRISHHAADIRTALGEQIDEGATGLSGAAEDCDHCRLLAFDRAFDRAAAERGIDGWLSYFTPDAARIVPMGPIARGHEAIRRLDGPTFADPKMMLTWEPVDAGLFDTGDHGYTRGRYRVMRVDDGRKDEISTGWYRSVWRREERGWKVILDTGGPDEKPGD